MTIRGGIIGLAVLVGSMAAAQEDAPLSISPVDITGDAAAGERIFRRCSACHEVGEGAENKVGPVLNGVVGRHAAAIPDYDYSDALREAGAAGLVWTVADLQAYLEHPRDTVPGNKMTFAGLRDADQRNDVIAYLYQTPPKAEGE